MEEWINLIPNKKLINIKLENNLSDKYNKLTKMNYIISFDIEFLRYSINNSQVPTIHELGGLLFEKKNNIWYFMYIFHFNLIPIINNIKQYYLLTSQYNTLSDDTLKKIIEIENELLPENNINTLKKNKIIKRYLPKKIINKLLNEKDITIIKKKLSKIKYSIKGSDLYNKDYELFKKSTELILNDPDSVARQIRKEDEIKFINLTNNLFSKSYLIVKGLEDIKALKNHSLLLKQNSIKLINYFDIAQYNTMLFEKCQSAELEKNFICLDKLGLTKPFLKYNIIDSTKMKAHNPLVDAYYTWIIFNIYL